MFFCYILFQICIRIVILYHYVCTVYIYFSVLDSPGDLMSQMYQAANDIGTAMSEFVGKKGTPNIDHEYQIIHVFS